MAGASYYPTTYGRDLAVILADRAANSLSVCSFLPDYPDAEFFRDPARRLKQLPHSGPFVASVFWQVLADQATYEVTRGDLSGRGMRVRPPKLVGLLGTMHNNLHPAFLLIALSYGHLADRTTISPEIENIGRAMLPEVQRILNSSWPAVGTQMRDALGDGSVPDSIRAYVPHGDAYRLQPNWDAVVSWRGAARDTISEFIQPTG